MTEPTHEQAESASETNIKNRFVTVKLRKQSFGGNTALVVYIRDKTEYVSKMLFKMKKYE